MSQYRKGYVLSMWTGLIENPRTGRPILFSTTTLALRHLMRLPSWGRSAVEIRQCRVRSGSFIVGKLARVPGFGHTFAHGVGA